MLNLATHRRNVCSVPAIMLARWKGGNGYPTSKGTLDWRRTG